MKKKFFETKQFKALNKEWYGKLKESGFDDIETEGDIENDNITKQHITVDHAKVIYHQACMDHLESGVLIDPLDLFIFERHCDGVSSRDIASTLEENGFKVLDRRSVDRRILKILKDADIEPLEMRV